MAELQKQLQEIAEFETWLTRNLPAEPVPALEYLKLCVRVELGEQWLSRQLGAAEAGFQNIGDRVRAAVQATTMKRQSSAPARRGILQYIGAPIGLAAMLALTFLIVKPPKQAALEAIASDNDIVFPDDSEALDWEIDELDEELADFDGRVVLGSEPDTDDFDFALDSDF